MLGLQLWCNSALHVLCPAYWWHDHSRHIACLWWKGAFSHLVFLEGQKSNPCLRFPLPLPAGMPQTLEKTLWGNSKHDRSWTHRESEHWGKCSSPIPENKGDGYSVSVKPNLNYYCIHKYFYSQFTTVKMHKPYRQNKLSFGLMVQTLFCSGIYDLRVFHVAPIHNSGGIHFFICEWFNVTLIVVTPDSWKMHTFCAAHLYHNEHLPQWLEFLSTSAITLCLSYNTYPIYWCLILHLVFHLLWPMVTFHPRCK